MRRSGEQPRPARTPAPQVPRVFARSKPGRVTPIPGDWELDPGWTPGTGTPPAPGLTRAAPTARPYSKVTVLSGGRAAELAAVEALDRGRAFLYSIPCPMGDAGFGFPGRILRPGRAAELAPGRGRPPRSAVIAHSPGRVAPGRVRQFAFPRTIGRTCRKLTVGARSDSAPPAAARRSGGTPACGVGPPFPSSNDCKIISRS